LVKLLTNIRYRPSKDSEVVYRVNDEFELPTKQARAEIAALRVAEVVDVATEEE
jgi:hypothetical protein